MALLVCSSEFAFAQEEETVEEEASADEPGEPDESAEVDDETASSEVVAAGEKTSAVETAEGAEEKTGPAGDPDDGVQKGKKKKKKAYDLGSRVHVGFDAEHKQNENNAWDDTFYLKRARFKVDWYPEDWLDARIQFDVATVFSAGGMFLKDAFVRLKPFTQLELRAGLFKKPFSGLELTSSGKLKVISRGIGNSFALDADEVGGSGMAYGDRNIGLELAGELVESVGLEYAIGVFNGGGVVPDDSDDAKDLVARIGLHPVKQLSFGLSGSFRFFDDSNTYHPPWSAAGGVDVQLTIGGFGAHLEGFVAHNFLEAFDRQINRPDVSSVDLLFDGLVILSYKINIPSTVKLALEPVFKFEYLDPNDRIVDDHAMLYTIGLNTYVGKYFRVMLDFEILRAERFWQIDSGADDPITPELEDVEDHKETLMLLLCFDI